jgi:hypothetical protein
MGKNQLITADQAKAAGAALGQCCTELAAVSEIEAASGGGGNDYVCG